VGASSHSRRWAYLLRGIGGAGLELSDILPQQDYPVYNLTPVGEKCTSWP